MHDTLTYKSEKARHFYAMHRTKQSKIINHYTPKIFNVLKRQYLDFIKVVREHGPRHARVIINDIITPEPMVKVLKDLYLRSAYIESNYVLNTLRPFMKPMVLKRVGGSASFSLGFGDLAPVIDSYFNLRLLSDSVIPINDNTKKYILRWLLAEIEGGKDYETAIADFRALAIDGLKPKAKLRAGRIALGESTRALSFGGMIGAYMSGVDVDKVWVTSDDERVRGLPNYPATFSHVALDLNSSSIFGAFYNGERIKFPGDPDASPENTGGCRCAQYFRPKRVNRKPRVQGRKLSNFITDFIAGLLTGVIAELINNDTVSQ